MILYITFFSVALLTYSWRYFYTSVKKNFINPHRDMTTHLYLVKMLSAPYRRPFFLDDERFVFYSRCTYPPLFHYLLARTLGYERLKRHLRFINPVLETVFNLVYFYFSYRVFHGPLDLSRDTAIIAAFLVSVWYIFSPIFLFLAGRVSIFGGRTFNYHLGMYSLMSMVLFLYTGSLVWFAAAVFFNICIVFSSQFSLQVVIFFQALASLYRMDPYPLVSVLIAFVLAWALNPRWVTAFVKSKWAHYKWYHRGVRENTINLTMAYNGFWGRFLLWSIPFVSLGVMWKNWLGGLNSPVLALLLLYGAISLVVCILIYIPVLRPYGAAHRYLEFGLPFIYITAVYYCVVNDLMTVLAGIIFIYFVLTLKEIVKFSTGIHEDDDALEEVIEFLQKHQDKTILSIPLKLAVYLPLHLDNRVLYSINPTIESINKISKKFLYPIDDFDKINGIQPFDWILFRRGVEGYDLDKYTLLFRNRRFEIYDYRRAG